jgi:ElaB/YqjD/DUF883 family membrane-anchored ribosome-binding protein
MEAQATRERLAQEFSAVITDSEKLLKDMASAGGERAQALRSDLELKLQEARVRLDRMQKQADEYVHANPWQSVAIATAVGAIIGIVLGLVLNRH